MRTRFAGCMHKGYLLVNLFTVVCRYLSCLGLFFPGFPFVFWSFGAFDRSALSFYIGIEGFDEDIELY